MENLILQAIYSIPKLDLEMYCSMNGIQLEELYEIVENYPDENIKYLFLNRYPRNVDKENPLSGENIIKQILKISHMKIGEIAKTYGVSRRWIFRILKKEKEINPQLYNLYRKSRLGILSSEEQKMIDEMPINEISCEQIKRVKVYSTKTRKTEAIFKSDEEIKEKIYEEIAETCETLEEFEQKIKSENVQKIILNRIKKQKVIIEIFEKECDSNLEDLYMKLQQRSVNKRILESFRKIDEEDSLIDIYRKKFEEKGEK